LFSSKRIASSCFERGWVLGLLVAVDSSILVLFFTFPAFEEEGISVERVALEFAIEFLVLCAIEFSLEEAEVLRGVA
jgi:hypothetical protein